MISCVDIDMCLMRLITSSVTLEYPLGGPN